MDEGQWNEAREGAQRRLAGMLDRAHAIALTEDNGPDDGPIEIRIDQRVTLEFGGGHAKWNATTRADVFDMTEEEEATLEAKFG